jgi:chorismate lyase / 3-hydroxybenzoate synthase
MITTSASPEQTRFHSQYLDAREGALAEALATVVFDGRCQTPSDMRYLSTGLPQLTGQPCHEHLLSNGVVKRGQSRDSAWAETDQCLVVALWANEADYDGLQHATAQLYSRLLDQVASSGYPHLVRVWNYFPDINRIDNDLERYRQFCIGRFDAFANHDLGEPQFPSACALGNQGGDLVIYALASKVKPWHFENPRQASAYHYPSEYGPRSPSFARASLLTLPEQPPRLYVSGTASVVGHITQHPNHLPLQTDVTLENLTLLLAHVAEQYALVHSGQTPDFTPEVLKVYLRHRQDLDYVQKRVEHAYPGTPVVFVAADICRADLRLEIDGLWRLQR